jgi:hypothetical protein
LDKKHTAETVRTTVQEILEEFSAWRPGNVYVTDNGSNVKAAFKNMSWLGCAGHNLNLVLSNGLKEDADDVQFDDDAPDHLLLDVLQVTKVCKSIVQHVKRTRLQAKLDTTLKQAVATRWNSTLNTLNSVKRNADDLKKLADEFGDKKLQRLLLDLDITLLEAVIEVLTPFDTATKVLSTDQVPSLHLVTGIRRQLKLHLVSLSGFF